MTVEQIAEILQSLGIVKGAVPLTKAQLDNLIQNFTESEWPWPNRERHGAEYDAWKVEHDPAIIAAYTVNAFNTQLVAYRDALERLALPVASEGRAEVRGLVDGMPDPVTGEVEQIEVVLQEAVEALPAQITGFDENENPVLIDNPAIAADLAEREAAQAVVDATPAEVVEFASSENEQ